MKKSLTLTEIWKYPERTSKFLDYYKNGKEFLLHSTEIVKFKYCEEIYTNILNKIKVKFLMTKEINNIIEERNVKFTELVKTNEFGGKSYSTTRIEESHVENFQLPLKLPFNLVHRNVTYYDIVRLEKTKGTCKCDFHFVNIDNKPVFFISHKDGSKVTDFQQWGGLVEFKEHREVIEFHNHIKNNIVLEPKSCYYREILDENLVNSLIYGKNYGSSYYGFDNVNLVIQGDFNLNKIIHNNYEIKYNHGYSNRRNSAYIL